MDNLKGALANFLGQQPVTDKTLQAVQKAAFKPDVLEKNARRLCAIYSRFISVEMSVKQAKEILEERTLIDCCHPCFADNPHLIPIMIAARDRRAYQTAAGWVAFVFEGAPQYDGVPFSVLRLGLLDGEVGDPKRVRKILRSPQYSSLSATELDLDNLVQRVFPERPVTEPEERLILPGDCLIEVTRPKGPPACQQLSLPGFGVYARQQQVNKQPQSPKGQKMHPSIDARV
ncbi:MAG: hypothetical protein AB7E52_02140 [Bdellovibrionales bacterium]